MEEPVAKKPNIKLLQIFTVEDTLHFLDISGQPASFREQGVELLVACSGSDRLKAFCEKHRVQGFAVPMSRNISPLADLVSIYRLYRIIRQVRPDIIQGNTPKAGLLAGIAGWLARVPVRIYHLLGFPIDTAQGLTRTLLFMSEKTACALSHHVLGIGHSLRERAIETRVCPPAKISVIGSGSAFGLDAETRFNRAILPDDTRTAIRRQYAIPDDAVVLGFVGRLVRMKGVVELVAAWEKLRDHFPHAHLLLVGYEEDREPLPDAVKRRIREDPRISLTDRQDDVAPFYAAMDIFCFPTYREGFGNVLLEAAAMGVPTVATRVTGCLDSVADGVTGTLVTFGNIDELEAVIARYIEDPALRQRHGRAGRERILREFQPAHISVETVRVYRRLLDRRYPGSQGFEYAATGRKTALKSEEEG